MFAGRGRSGFTLAEALISLWVITALCLAIFTLFPTALLAQSRAEYQRRAGLLAHNVLEEARARPYSSLQSPMVFYDVEESGISYHRSLSVETVSGYTPDRLLYLRAQVRYHFRERQYVVERELYASKSIF